MSDAPTLGRRCVERSELEHLLRGDGPGHSAPTYQCAAAAMEEVAARLSLDPLMLPERVIQIGPHRLCVDQKWNADTAADNTGSACWPGSQLLAYYLLSPAAHAGVLRDLAPASVEAATSSCRLMELGCGGAVIPSTCLALAFPDIAVTLADRTTHVRPNRCTIARHLSVTTIAERIVLARRRVQVCLLCFAQPRVCPPTLPLWQLLELAAQNVGRNLGTGARGVGRCTFAQVDWGAPLPAGVVAASFDVIICAELLYDVSAVPLLLKTVWHSPPCSRAQRCRHPVCRTCTLRVRQAAVCLLDATPETRVYCGRGGARAQSLATATLAGNDSFSGKEQNVLRARCEKQPSDSDLAR